MIIWLNGTFGAGKTSAATELAGILPAARQFDPEWVGYMLKANLADLDFTDFQQLPSWRTLVPVVMAEVAAARPWLEASADVIVDSTQLSAAEVARVVAAATAPLMNGSAA